MRICRLSYTRWYRGASWQRRCYWLVTLVHPLVLLTLAYMLYSGSRMMTSAVFPALPALLESRQLTFLPDSWRLVYGLMLLVAVVAGGVRPLALALPMAAGYAALRCVDALITLNGDTAGYWAMAAMAMLITQRAHERQVMRLLTAGGA